MVIDSLELRNLSTIAYENLKLGDTLLFKKQNKETLALAKKLKDSFAIGDTQWNYASYYADSQVNDSAYYYFNNALKYFKEPLYTYEKARMLYGMAYAKGRFKDYIGSEILIFEAIKRFELLNKYRNLYYSYNYLGQLQNDIKNYDKALNYYNEALNYLQKLKNPREGFPISLNNIGVAYLKKGTYPVAIDYFNKALKQTKNRNNYAMIISNKAYSRLLMKDTTNVARLLYEGFYIRDSLKNKDGILSSKIYLTKYYAYVKDTLKAINYAKEANSLARNIKNGRDYLESLQLLANLDPEYSKAYLEEHIRFSDSLTALERNAQNKFTRIDYETDGYIREAERLTQQKTRIFIISFSVLIILALLYFLRMQRVRNEKLQLEAKQQSANEKIYLLTLKQQDKLEKERVNERNRISQELHDGVLGKLFGVRVGLGFLMMNTKSSIKKEHDTLLNELQTIEQEIRDVSHELNNNTLMANTSFKALLEELVSKKSKLDNMDIKLDYGITNDEKIDEFTKVNVYRIIQEATQNVIKYASAENVFIILSNKNDMLSLTIEDNGKGFKLKKKHKGIGLKNMYSRVNKLNGIFNVNSSEGIGTKIDIQIPLK